ncbi:hypothetical protein [Frigoribacterium sp. PhB160]|uniref:hypothetical protein n=1 Tax=Frigoribacterium sp. PhB160 TaxID=2485192 RepID=UPI0013150A43|nr:hypothetical protein [Frigoribacterium sp. PhB160]
MPPLPQEPHDDPPSPDVLHALKPYIARYLLGAEGSLDQRRLDDPQLDVTIARPYVIVDEIADEFENDRRGGDADPALAVLFSELRHRRVIEPLPAEARAELVASDQRRGPRATPRPDAYARAWQLLSLDDAVRCWPDAFEHPRLPSEFDVAFDQVLDNARRYLAIAMTDARRALERRSSADPEFDASTVPPFFSESDVIGNYITDMHGGRPSRAVALLVEELRRHDLIRSLDESARAALTASDSRRFPRASPTRPMYGPGTWEIVDLPRVALLWPEAFRGLDASGK